MQLYRLIYYFWSALHVSGDVLRPSSGALNCIYSHRDHHVHKGLGVFPVHWSSKWNWSVHLFLGRTMSLRPFGL